MDDNNKIEATKKQKQQQQQTTSPQDPLEESTENRKQHSAAAGAAVVVVTGAPYIPPLYVSGGGASSGTFEQQQFDALNPKRPRYGSGQWKLLPSPSQQKQTQMAILSSESSPSPTTNPQAQPHTAAATASSSDTASSPSHSPIPSLSGASGQEGNKPEGEQFHQQFRKGKYVSPVWKPNEMLWLARAWRIQYQGGSDGSGSSSRNELSDNAQGGGGGGGDVAVLSVRGKTRADKDREVAEFLNGHGVSRDAKTAGTKWDNMLGEFRKVYEWERRGEREQGGGKSYFRLSPYERKLHRLPASFDEEVFEELSQFMGSRMRTPHSRGGASAIVSLDDTRKALPPPPPFKEDDTSLSGI